MNLKDVVEAVDPEPALIELPARMTKHLGELADLGVYGDTIAAVAEYLIQREIDDLMRVGVIVPVRG